MAATTTLLGLVTPTQGSLSGTWGDTVNYGIYDYVDIAIAGTLSFANDGAITLANTTGSSSGNSITTTTAQYMVIRITGTQSVVKVITGPSYSKLYMVDHAGATSAVTFKAAGQTGVTVAVGEKCFVYYNGTDYVKIVSNINLTSQVTGILPIANGGTGTSSTTFTDLTTNVTGTLPATNGGTGSASAFTQYGVPYASTTSVLATTAAGTTGQVLTAATGGAPTWAAPATGITAGKSISFALVFGF
jgi:hypothetical protein